VLLIAIDHPVQFDHCGGDRREVIGEGSVDVMEVATRKIDRARDAVMAEILAGWTDAEVTKLTDLVGRLAASMHPRS
jgi:hypothetical protein